MDKKRFLFLSFTLIIVMLFSALGPTTVYADDGAPPEPAPAEATVSEGVAAEEEGEPAAQTDGTGGGEADEAVTGEAVSAEAEVVATEEAVTEETEVTASEEAVTEGAVESETDSAAAEEPSLMEQVPDNTEVVVVNPEGVTEPLATQEAADAVAVSDPIWCPAGVGPGGADCTDSFPSFDALLTELEGNATYSGPGTIYVEMGTYNTSETSIDFNNYNLANISSSSLTIQGGWNISDNTTTATTTFDIPIIIGNSTTPWGGSLTLNNIIVSGVVGDVGLTVYSAADVTIQNSTFTNNDTAGAVVDADGDVTVRNSNISDNGSNDWNVVDGRGLEINSRGFVTLNGVIANDNQISGANIIAADGVAITDSTFNGNLMYTTDFAEFFGYGLTIVSGGDVSLGFCNRTIPNNNCTGTIVGVHANDNFLWGASITAPNVFIEESFFNRNVSDSVSFIDDTGLIIVSTGDVFLDNIEANENRLIGADILAGGQVDISNSSFSRNFGTTVDAAGNDVFWGCGLQIGGVQVGSLAECGRQVSPASAINLDSVTADDNYLFGANLFSSGLVNISGSSFSRNATPADQANAQGGLMVQSGGDVSLNTVTVNDNRMFGADIVATGQIDIEDSVFSNNLNGAGLTASTPSGLINLTNVVASGNGADGANLETNCDIFVAGGTFAGNTQYGINAITRSLTQNPVPTFAPPANGAGPTLVTAPAGVCPFTSPPANSFASPQLAAALYTVATLTQDQLPGPLSQGNAFASAYLVSLTAQGQATANLAITLSFPIPAGMDGANLSVMFWNGSGWVAVPGGGVVGSEFVVTVTQPGIYVLVSQ